MCPFCGKPIKKTAPLYKGIEYCCSDCAIDTWMADDVAKKLADPPGRESRVADGEPE